MTAPRKRELFVPRDPNIVTTKEYAELCDQVRNDSFSSLSRFQRGRMDLAIRQMMTNSPMKDPSDEEIAAAIMTACRVNAATA